ncbi:hypothetical protein N7457_002296 [Penicillium paradoxum]|uniref:uncharacterized protein n=1 Tax=Penicillium paradoxum TaxID=176176 RepID=UPI00254990EA|nr:uncharacterized protein N7457_002296 [Penicillium paradoxum]KAJ5787306.1 hypothetical protein N7457_002296 [Penicillium paradoxum]
MSLTCRGFRRLALPVLFETLHVHFLVGRGDTGRQMLQDLQEAGDELLRCVRILIVSGGFLYKPDEDIPALVSPWRGRFPLPYRVLQDLDARQLVPSLYFEGWPSKLLDAPVKHVSHCIRSLSVASSDKASLDRVKDVLVSLPCLDRLDMKYFNHSKRDSAPLFSLGSADSIPSLRTLCLTNFTVDPKRENRWDQCHHLRHLGLDGRGESLELLTLFTGKIPNVTSLTLRIHDGTSPDISEDLCSRLDNLLQSVNNLAAFTAYDLSKDIIPLLVSRHGPQLRRLQFRQTGFNKRDQDQIRCLFTFKELQNLARTLPRLQRLGIDLRFKGHLSYDVLSGAACFPSLEHLELNSNFPFGETGANNRRPMVDSWLNTAVVELAFRYVVGEKRYYERITDPTTVPWSHFTALDVKGVLLPFSCMPVGGPTVGREGSIPFD